ncbi:MAG: energy-coupling factor ABC transporter permease [Pseudomonadota bacterium]
MHIEPGIVDGAKMVLSYGTALAVFAYTAKLAWGTIKQSGPLALALRSAIVTALVFCFFEVLPHYPVGVSEVHFILGSTLFLMFGAAPAAIGLALGLLAQGALLAPADLPQYGMNVTTLLVPLFAVAALARRIVPANTAYKDVSYAQCFKLSTAYQAGVVTWVGFWAFYGHGVSAATLADVSTFGLAYMSVVLIEPLVDMAVLAAAKSLHQLRDSMVFHDRFHRVTAHAGR